MVACGYDQILPAQGAALDTARTIDDMDLPGVRLHRLKGEWQGRWSMTVSGRELAAKLDVSASAVSRMLTGSSRVTPEMALRLSKALGRSAESWLAMQDAYDLWRARQRVDLQKVATLRLAAA